MPVLERCAQQFAHDEQRIGLGEVGEQPNDVLLQKAVEMQPNSQPFRYPTGLIEVPMSPVSDVMAMRIARWSRKSWLASLRRPKNRY